MRLKEIVSISKGQSFEFNGLNKADHGARPGRKSRVGSDTAKAWAYCEASTGTTVNYKFRKKHVSRSNNLSPDRPQFFH